MLFLFELIKPRQQFGHETKKSDRTNPNNVCLKLAKIVETLAMFSSYQSIKMKQPGNETIGLIDE